MSQPRTHAVPSGPSGLSDYAVSPLGMPVALLRNEVRVAFLGRTSTDDQQDPRQSMLRQLGNCKASIPESWVIVAHFYDVESGRMELDQRGRGENYERYDIPIARDGGVADLLDESTHKGRRFDVVICESVSRVARRTYEGLSIERELERVEVPLFASNEPITLTGSRAQRILQRRINQSVAEYEVLNTLEQSWGGLCTHVREGWNIGKPPYGYKAKTYRHPNPTKAAKGQTKTRLEPDGVKAETVTQIAMWRYHQGLGYGTIADLLNADLAKYPPPEPPSKARARGAWSKSSVCDLLRNPKYTGFQVFNRRATRSKRGKVNSPVLWVWSPEPVHEPLIPKWMFDEMTTTRKARQGSRDDDASVHSTATRTYLLRGMVFDACGRRMYGSFRNQRVYYMCSERSNNRGRPDRYSDHAEVVYVREDAIMEGISAFFADRVFGPERRALLEADLAAVDDREAVQQRAEAERAERALADIERRQAAILRQAQDGDDAFSRGLRQTYNELDEQKRALVTNTTSIGTTVPIGPSDADIALLDALPHLVTNLSKAPDLLLRQLFKITQLGVRLNDDHDHLLVTLRLPSAHLSEVADTAERIAEAVTVEPKTPDQAPNPCTDLVGAPDGIRTRTVILLRDLPLPIGLRGRGEPRR